MNYFVDQSGYYGDFGGAYIPEMLYPNVEELRQNYLNIIQEESFKKEFHQLLKDYVGRPSPLYLAKRLSARYNANIFLKREDLNHTGAHKINNTIGQILLAERLGKKRIIAETGAGQHGVATATVCALRGLECVVYMGEIDIQRQAPNVARMKMLGATVVPATSGSKTLKDATNEAMRDWVNNPIDRHYIIGSVVGPHPYPDMVAIFQSIISQETKKQLLEQTGNDQPDYVLACVGGGSNAMGMFYHFIQDEKVKLIAVEAAGKGVNSGHSAATTALGKEGVLHGSRSILMQTEDGQVVEPFSVSAGLDYPGIGPQHAHLFKTGRGTYVSITDDESLQAGLLCTQLEGIIPAIESAHALAYLEKMKFNGQENVVVCLSGRGDKDMDTINKLFQDKKSNILSIYYTAGFPGLEDTLKIAEELEQAGADLLEIGFPYSDPVADGPVIQASSKQALENGMSLKTLFKQLKELRSRISIPVLLMGYVNPMLQFGVENFCQACAEVGVDGCIVPDLPMTEYELHYQETFKKYGLCNIFLVTPQTSDERIHKIDVLTTGFIYLLSSSATTGKNLEVSQSTEAYFSRIKGMNLKNPLMIGFGIHNKATFDQACTYASGAIIGTAFVKSLNESPSKKSVTAFMEAFRA
eukprot:gene16858-20232_t